MGGWLQRRAGLVVVLVTLLLGVLLFVVRLGSTGLVDETPPLFAASARAMAATGDWLVPQVNGLPRYDKPPLVYWLMALVHHLPGQERWDPLGSWAAGLPSALATVALMLVLADTLRRWPQARVAGSNASAPRPGLAPE
ncbi:MAG: ArnT family glycosyltransferase, partial [Cyanobium sp.]